MTDGNKDEDEQLIWVNERVQYARPSAKYGDQSSQGYLSSESPMASARSGRRLWLGVVAALLGVAAVGGVVWLILAMTT